MSDNLENISIEELKEQKEVLTAIQKVKEENLKRSLESAYISIEETLKENPEIKEEIDKIIAEIEV